jgi:hypothetical protein
MESEKERATGFAFVVVVCDTMLQMAAMDLCAA